MVGILTPPNSTEYSYLRSSSTSSASYTCTASFHGELSLASVLLYFIPFVLRVERTFRERRHTLRVRAQSWGFLFLSHSSGGVSPAYPAGIPIPTHQGRVEMLPGSHLALQLWFSCPCVAWFSASRWDTRPLVFPGFHLFSFWLHQTPDSSLRSSLGIRCGGVQTSGCVGVPRAWALRL